MFTQDLKQALEALGERVNDKQVFKMLSEVDPNNSGTLTFFQFKNMVMAKREDE